MKKQPTCFRISSCIRRTARSSRPRRPCARRCSSSSSEALTMSISSTQYFNMNVATMSDQQAQLSQLYAQISSGVSLSTPSDNPLGAAQAVQLSTTGAALAQYTANQNTALASLQQEDSALGSVNSVLQSVHTLILRAGDGSLNDND